MHHIKFGVKMCLENMFGEDQRRGCLVPDMFSDPHEYAQFFDELNDPDNFTCCIDTGHAGITGEDCGDTIRVMGSRVRALHLNDNDFRTDGHLIPFQGKIDWDDVMRALAEIDYQGDFTFEALHLYEAEGEMSIMRVPTRKPPSMPITSAYIVSRGVITASPSTRGRTRKSTGSSPKVISASTSSLACILPMIAANEAPVRPASTIPVSTGPMTRTMDTLTSAET